MSRPCLGDGTYRWTEALKRMIDKNNITYETIWSVIYTLILLRVAPSLSSPDPLALHSSSPVG